MSEDSIKITLATTNPGKIQEIGDYFQSVHSPVEIVMPDVSVDVEETGSSFVENALIKAKASLPIKDSRWVLAEDSGFIIPALAGQYQLDPFPGIYSSRWMTQEIRKDLLGVSSGEPVSFKQINDGILQLMTHEKDRSAYYEGAMVLVDNQGKTIFTALSKVPLRIIDGHQPRGTLGFGYDPIVCLSSDQNQTLAELPVEQKNAISHRGQLLDQLKDFVESYY